MSKQTIAHRAVAASRRNRRAVSEEAGVHNKAERNASHPCFAMTQCIYQLFPPSHLVGRSLSLTPPEAIGRAVISIFIRAQSGIRNKMVRHRTGAIWHLIPQRTFNAMDKHGLFSQSGAASMRIGRCGRIGLLLPVNIVPLLEARSTRDGRRAATALASAQVVLRERAHFVRPSGRPMLKTLRSTGMMVPH